MIDLLKKKKKVEEVVPQGSTFTPDPSAQPVAQPQPEPSNPYLDLLRKRQEDARKEETITSLAGLATTALSGDLAGDIGTTAMSLMDSATKRRQDLEDQEMKFAESQLKGRETASKPQQYTYLDGKGQVRRGLFQGGVFHKSETDPLAGFAPKGMEDALGNKYLVNAVGGRTMVHPLQEGQLAPKAESFLQSQLKEFNKDKKEIEKTVYNMRDALSRIGTGDFQTKIAIMSLIKQIETRMTDADRDYYTLPVFSLRQIRARVNQFNDGVVHPTLVREVKDSLESVIKNNKIWYDHMRKNKVQQISSMVGISPEIADMRLGGFTDTGTLPRGKTTKPVKVEEKDNKKEMDKGIEAVKGISKRVFKALLNTDKDPSPELIKKMSYEQLLELQKKRKGK